MRRIQMVPCNRAAKKRPPYFVVDYEIPAGGSELVVFELQFAPWYGPGGHAHRGGWGLEEIWADGTETVEGTETAVVARRRALDAETAGTRRRLAAWRCRAATPAGAFPETAGDVESYVELKYRLPRPPR